jgi:hypothetical protein
MPVRHQPRSTTDPALQRDQAPDEPVDRAAVAGSLSVWVGSPISDLRPGREVWARGSCGGPIPEDSARADLPRKPVAERRGGALESCRRDLLDHVIVVNERHLKRLLSEYVGYYHQDRTHLGLGKGTPNNRLRSIGAGRVLSQERLGGLHHRYDRAA